MRQTVSNPCYDGQHSDCGLHAPDGKPCACKCHTSEVGAEQEMLGSALNRLSYIVDILARVSETAENETVRRELAIAVISLQDGLDMAHAAHGHQMLATTLGD